MSKNPDVDWVPLADVRDLLLSELEEADNPALRMSLQRILDSLDEPGGMMSAFSSFVE